MRHLRFGIAILSLALVAAGCGGSGDTTTTFPDTPPTAPPEADQMKSEMMKRYLPKGAAPRAGTPSPKK